ncbi:Suppressor protein STM1 [Cytospora mali]|uniref:Suppressor protein STM1 n=1 Tax=Cytospora mali TaxID=578113 RepID=A0A194VMH9_CYTMA|nr:Suppressor protein STM1 [Valsa mali]
MSVASKNLYALLGNDVEGSETPSAPVNTVTKTSTKTGKPNADGTAPAKSAATSSARPAPRGGFNANETAFRDGGVGPGANRRKPTDEAPRGGSRGGRGARSRGGRGATHHRNADDRHTKNVAPGSEKQAAQAWGAAEGEAELKDEQAGEAIAQTEQKDAEAEDAEAEDKEPEVKQVTLEAYLAEQAEKKAALNAAQAVRKANEGDEKKWAGAKPLTKEGDEDFIPSSGGKKQRERERKQKLTVDYDGRWQESNTTERPRGGARGGAERGERRGGPRGGARGGARGGPRGGPQAGPRGGPQSGPRGRGAAPINPNDASAFPALGK